VAVTAIVVLHTAHTLVIGAAGLPRKLAVGILVAFDALFLETDPPGAVIVDEAFYARPGLTAINLADVEAPSRWAVTVVVALIGVVADVAYARQHIAELIPCTGNAADLLRNQIDGDLAAVAAVAATRLIAATFSVAAWLETIAIEDRRYLAHTGQIGRAGRIGGTLHRLLAGGIAGTLDPGFADVVIAQARGAIEIVDTADRIDRTGAVLTALAEVAAATGATAAIAATFAGAAGRLAAASQGIVPAPAGFGKLATAAL